MLPTVDLRPLPVLPSFGDCPCANGPSSRDLPSFTVVSLNDQWRNLRLFLKVNYSFYS